MSNNTSSFHFLAVGTNIELFFRIFIRVVVVHVSISVAIVSGWKEFLPSKRWVVNILLLCKLLLIKGNAVDNSSFLLWVLHHHHHWRVLLEKSLRRRGRLIHVAAVMLLVCDVLALVEWSIFLCFNCPSYPWSH